jgi:hypothetical protein
MLNDPVNIPPTLPPPANVVEGGVEPLMGDNPTDSNPRKFEDYLLERIGQDDLEDLLKTMVAFANSVRPGHVATILIGERSDGTPEGLADAEEIQRKVRQCADKIYPQIIWRSETYVKEGKECLKVEIEYSGDTPHFGGPAWVWKGSEPVLASDKEFQRLIDTRSSMVRELAQRVDTEVTVLYSPYETYGATLLFVNRFALRVDLGSRVLSYPLKHVMLSWDDENDRLMIIVEEDWISTRRR